MADNPALPMATLKTKIRDENELRNPNVVKVVTDRAAAAGIDALFMEIHADPDQALCDGPNMLDLKGLPEVLKTVMAIGNAVGRP